MFNIIECIITTIKSDTTPSLVIVSLFLFYFYLIVVLTWIHEIGHAIVITTYAILNKRSFKTCISINIEYFLFTGGYTKSEAYKNIEGHNFAVRCNSISGILAEVLFTGFSICLLLFYSAIPEIRKILYAIAIIIAFFFSFVITLTGCNKPNNDFYIFRHPEQFKYEPEQKK